MRSCCLCCVFRQEDSHMARLSGFDNSDGGSVENSIIMEIKNKQEHRPKPRTHLSLDMQSWFILYSMLSMEEFGFLWELLSFFTTIIFGSIFSRLKSEYGTWNTGNEYLD